MSKVNVIVQARLGSSRLPAKILKSLCDKTVMEHVIERLNRCQLIDNIIIATTTNTKDDPIADYCNDSNILYYRGSEDNVLNRYYQAALISNTDIIVRVTSDCPLIDAKYIDLMIKTFFKENLKYLGPKYFGDHKFPDGFNGEVFTFEVLKEANENANKFELEHVSTYIIKKYKTIEFEYPIHYGKFKNINFNKLHLSLDTENDYKVLENIFKNVYSVNDKFTIYDVLEYLNDNPNLLQNNEDKGKDGDFPI